MRPTKYRLSAISHSMRIYELGGTPVNRAAAEEVSKSQDSWLPEWLDRRKNGGWSKPAPKSATPPKKVKQKKVARKSKTERSTPFSFVGEASSKPALWIKESLGCSGVAAKAIYSAWGGDKLGAIDVMEKIESLKSSLERNP